MSGMSEIQKIAELRDQINVARAALCCLAREADDVSTPVHATSLNAFYKRYFPGQVCIEMMVLLQSLREAVSLPNGFWYPTPPRLVKLQDRYLLLSSQPTQHLEKFFDVSEFGLARLLERGDFEKLPEQSLGDWLGVQGELEQWFEAEINACIQCLCDTRDDGRSVEVFDCWGGGKSHWDFWRDIKESVRIPDRALCLCREKASFGQTRYFVGRIANNKLIQEAVRRIDDIRMRYGFMALTRKAPSYRLDYDDVFVRLNFRQWLPKEEMRLLQAIGIPLNANSRSSEYIFQKWAFPVVEDLLNGLRMKRGD